MEAAPLQEYENMFHISSLVMGSYWSSFKIVVMIVITVKVGQLQKLKQAPGPNSDYQGDKNATRSIL